MPTALARSLLRHLHASCSRYTPEPRRHGRDAIDEFWLDRREGFCEHFAAAFVVVMRAPRAGARRHRLPGNRPGRQDGYYLVRQSYAHAWAEYWHPGRGWVRADPTAAVAPDRIVRSHRPRAAARRGGRHAGRDEPAACCAAAARLGAANNRWNQWVLNSRAASTRPAQAAGRRSPNWEDLALLLVGALAGSLAGAAWAWSIAIVSTPGSASSTA